MDDTRGKTYLYIRYCIYDVSRVLRFTVIYQQVLVDSVTCIYAVKSLFLRKKPTRYF